MGNHIYGSGGRPGEEEAALREIKEKAQTGRGLVINTDAGVSKLPPMPLKF